MALSFRNLLQRYGTIYGSKLEIPTSALAKNFHSVPSNYVQQIPRPRSNRKNLLLYGISSAAFYSVSNNLSIPFSTHAAADYAPDQAHLSISKNEMKPSSSLPEVVIYQYEVCPFCNKVRAYLDYNNIPYKVIEVDPLWKTELKQFSDTYRKVPIAIVNGEQINGSFQVINHVNSLIHGKETSLSKEEKEWINWLDDYFIHLVAPNIYRSPSESLQTFDYIVNNAKFSTWQKSAIRYSGASIMYMVGKKMKKKYSIENEREEMHQALKKWTDAIDKNGGKFFNGMDEPGIVDLSIYGVLKAIYTFDTFTEISERNEALKDWYDRTCQAVGDTCVTDRQ